MSLVWWLACCRCLGGACLRLRAIACACCSGGSCTWCAQAPRTSACPSAPAARPPCPLQLERLAADKAAQQLQLERDLQAARQEAQQVGAALRCVALRRTRTVAGCLRRWARPPFREYLIPQPAGRRCMSPRLHPLRSGRPACAAQVKRRAAVERSISAADEAASLVPMDRIGDAYQRCGPWAAPTARVVWRTDCNAAARMLQRPAACLVGWHGIVGGIVGLSGLPVGCGPCNCWQAVCTWQARPHTAWASPHSLALPTNHLPANRPSRRLANNNRVGGAIKAGAQLIDSTATQASA